MTRMQKGPEFAWLAAITVLVGAFLLFQVQPIVARYILPWHGGSPAVWTTCMLFFQLLPMGGYLYAHLVGTPSRDAATAADPRRAPGPGARAAADHARRELKTGRPDVADRHTAARHGRAPLAGGRHL